MTTALPDPRWRFVGRLCLDFAMTGGRGRWARVERLGTPADLRDWFAEGPLAVAGVPVSPAELAAAGDLREAIQRIAFALLDHTRPPAEPVAVVNAFAAAPPLARALDPRTLALTLTTATSAALLSEIARDALDLAADPHARERVRRCESPDCELLFLDDSRPGNRRWCSPGRCGDRARARAYRARRSGGSMTT